MRQSIPMEEGDQQGSQLKLGWWELGRNLLRLGPKTLLEPCPLQYYPEVEPGLGVGERTGPRISTKTTRHL